MNKPKKEQYYSVAEIAQNGFLPWIRHPRSIVNFIKRDAKDKNFLKVAMTSSKVKGDMFGQRYHIKGANIIKAVEAFEKGKLFKKQ